MIGYESLFDSQQKFRFCRLDRLFILFFLALGTGLRYFREHVLKTDGANEDKW
jgi:hypothetical protein